MTSDTKQVLLDKLNTHTARIAVIGLSHVGLLLHFSKVQRKRRCSGQAFAEAGFPVTFDKLSGGVGIDVDPTKVDAIKLVARTSATLCGA